MMSAERATKIMPWLSNAVSVLCLAMLTWIAAEFYTMPKRVLILETKQVSMAEWARENNEILRANADRIQNIQLLLAKMPGEYPPAEFRRSFDDLKHRVEELEKRARL
jgi:hypothetical protein